MVFNQIFKKDRQFFYHTYILKVPFISVQPNLYPTVGLQTPGEVVDANFGQNPFVYDIVEEFKVCTTEAVAI